ncbi:MAG: Dihydrolipoyllysine-residue acetyltransferase component of pyruvate dehydrogenase complex [Fimbriimonadaceae bacterium]|nr:Dihydrolipoyllysine-residue acetyltransferase component of pyruvate dehydrogenase complex [Fimbriimonadaceae bacterium]
MPKMGDGMEEGTLLEWLKPEGSAVKSGEVIGTIQTDKATLELESPGSGVLSGILVGAGETVPVGQPIAALLKEGEKLPSGWGNGKAAASPAATPAAPPAGKAEVVEPAAPAQPKAAGSKGRVIASPLAKKIAAEKGISLEGIAGTGPGGRITEKDVMAATSAGSVQMSVPTTPVASSAEDREVPLNRLRQITAQRTAQSKQEVPHFYVTVEVDVEKIQSLRDMFEAEGSGKVSVNDFVIAACIRALREMPEVNATYAGDKIKVYGAIHVGIAAAVDEGLLVPVVKNAHQLTLRELGARSRELVAKAREGKLHPDEMSGSTFSISNMGMLDVDSFSAIINQPNAAILAVGTARKKVVVNEADALEVRQRMNITGSFDHRVVDGAGGARFVNIVKSYLENPTRILQ